MVSEAKDRSIFPAKPRGLRGVAPRPPFNRAALLYQISFNANWISREGV